MAAPTANGALEANKQATSSRRAVTRQNGTDNTESAPSEAFENNKTSTMAAQVSSKEHYFFQPTSAISPANDILTRLAQSRADLNERYGGNSFAQTFDRLATNIASQVSASNTQPGSTSKVPPSGPFAQLLSQIGPGTLQQNPQPNNGYNFVSEHDEPVKRRKLEHSSREGSAITRRFVDKKVASKNAKKKVLPSVEKDAFIPYGPKAKSSNWKPTKAIYPEPPLNATEEDFVFDWPTPSLTPEGAENLYTGPLDDAYFDEIFGVTPAGTVDPNSSLAGYLPVTDVPTPVGTDGQGESVVDGGEDEDEDDGLEAALMEAMAEEEDDDDDDFEAALIAALNEDDDEVEQEMVEKEGDDEFDYLFNE